MLPAVILCLIFLAVPVMGFDLNQSPGLKRYDGMPMESFEASVTASGSGPLRVRTLAMDAINLWGDPIAWTCGSGLYIHSVEIKGSGNLKIVSLLTKPDGTVLKKNIYGPYSIDAGPTYQPSLMVDTFDAIDPNAIYITTVKYIYAGSVQKTQSIKWHAVDWMCP
jgi:hypothetical protein